MKFNLYQSLNLRAQNLSKRACYSFLLMAAVASAAPAQVTLYESFTAPFNPASAGWSVQNLSSPAGTATWFQGTIAFNALVGAPTDYYAVNYNSTSSAGTTNTISNWLITPTLNLVNGAIVQFATRTTANTNFADRLQLYYSDAGAGTNVGNSAGTPTNTAGTFTNIVFDLNANQAATGYPGFWISMTATLSGIATPTVGRLALRYYLTNAGASGTTGNFVGVDEFRYSLPCNHVPAVVAWNVQPCAGNPVNLTVMGAGTTAITSYTWSTGVNTSTTSFIPSNTGIQSCYVLMETTAGCVNLEVANLNVLPSPTVSFVRSPNGNLCSGQTVTVTASGANSYTYVISPTQTITTTPLAANLPTVNTLTNVSFTLRGIGSNGCANTQTVSLAVNPNPTVTASGTSSALCIGKTATLSASGASTYSWSGSSTSTFATLNYSATAPAGTKSFSVAGTSAEGCISGTAVVSILVNNCTSIGDQSLSSIVNTYPNPFTDQLYIQGFTGNIKIYNELGQLAIEKQCHSSDEIDTRKLPAGVYLLQIKAYNHSITKKIIKQ
ncbi:hypothetical protein CNR22_23630 [Sphingobacteriaceae bacterium]|nr:hypothetical protein CNR22_23630 [Sphingobacteriaceae bacterium]